MLYRKNILDFLFLRLPGLNAQNHRLYKKTDTGSYHKVIFSDYYS